MNTSLEAPLFDIDYSEDQLHTPLTDDRYTEVENFCTPDSLKASCNYINILLTSYGYPVPLVFESNDTQDTCKIVNCIYTLIHDRKKDEKEREDYIEIIQQMKKERIELENQLTQAKREHQLVKKHYSETKAKLEANEAIHQKQVIQNTRLKEEISKVKHNLQYMKAQYSHETKRHEQELAKTQDRLVTMMNNRHQINVTTLDMNSHFATTLNNESDNDEIVQIRKMYTNLLNQTKEREIQARNESEDLRASLMNLYTGVRRLLETQIQQFDGIQTKQAPRNSFEEVARFRLPMDCGGKEAIELVNDLLDRLKAEWDYQIQDQPRIYTEQDMLEKQDHILTLEQTIEELLDTIDQTKEEYEEKTKMYRRFEQGGFFETLYPTPQDIQPMSDDEDDIVVDLVEGRPEKYNALRQKAMQDQHALTESAIELARQREQLEAERWAFNEMKRALEMQEVLHEPSNPSSPITPPTPSHLHRQTLGESDRARKRLRSFLGAPSER